MSSHVLDASALLALLQGESGAEDVEAVLGGAVISAVNYAEVVAKLADDGMPGASIEAAIEAVDLEVAPFDEALGMATGILRPTTRSLGLSLGDRACIALARRLAVPALTTDRAWLTLNVEVEVHVIR